MTPRRPVRGTVHRIGNLTGVKAWSEGGRVAFDEDKIGGPRHLQLTVDLEPGVDRIALQYYFSVFGDIRLPAPPA